MMPSDPKSRKEYPVGTFLREYFPDAIAYLAHLSWVANQQHNPGEPMHWAREKSTDQEDCLMRHFLEAGEVDADGMLHTGKLAWRALAMLQLELEDLEDDEELDDSDDDSAGDCVCNCERVCGIGTHCYQRGPYDDCPCADCVQFRIGVAAGLSYEQALRLHPEYQRPYVAKVRPYARAVRPAN